jgi:hypothetical protein
MRSYQLQLRNVRHLFQEWLHQYLSRPIQELVDSKHASIVSKSTFKQPSAVTIPAKALSLLIQSIRTAWYVMLGNPSLYTLFLIVVLGTF